MGTDKPEVGNQVVYRDSDGTYHPAFVIAVHSGDIHPLLNVVFLSTDATKLDAYGRAVLRATSVRHASERAPNGICWAWPREAFGPEPELDVRNLH